MSDAGSADRGRALTPTRLLTPAFVALFAAVLAFFTAGGIVLPVASRFAAGPLAADSIGVGVAIGAFAIAALLLRPVVGWASDRFGRRPLLLLGGVVTVVVLVLHLVVSSLPMFVLVRGALGIGEAFFFVAGLAAISDLAPDDRRGEAINVGSLALYGGLAIGPVIGETILGLGGYDLVWVAAAAIAVVATILCLLVPETSPTILAPRAGPRPRGRFIHPAGLFPGFLILTGAWGMAGFLAFIPLHATALGLDGAGLALAVYALVIVGLRIVFVKLPDQVGPARLSGAALVLSAIGLVVIAVAGEQVGLLVGTVVLASGVAFMFPGLMALAVARVDETERGSVVGTTSAFLDLSFGLAPAVLGVVAGVTGYAAAFGLSAGVALVGAALLFLRRDTIARPAIATTGRLPG